MLKFAAHLTMVRGDVHDVPDNAAPGGMGGATRMHDRSEALHDDRRRWLMNVARLPGGTACDPSPL